MVHLAQSASDLRVELKQLASQLRAPLGYVAAFLRLEAIKSTPGKSRPAPLTKQQ